MTKEQVVDAISSRTGINKVAAKLIVEKFMETIKESLSEGERISLRGFGSFVLKKRGERHFHAPSGKLFVIPPHDEPFFKPCKEFREIIKQ